METRFQKRPKNKKESHVVFYFKLNGKRVRIIAPAHYTLLTKDWDEGFPKPIAATKQLRTNLSDKKKLIDVYIEMIIERKQRLPTEVELRTYVSGLWGQTTAENKPTDGKTSLARLIDEFISLKTNVGKSTKNTIEKALDLLTEFRPSLDIEDITPKFDVEFNQWLLTFKGYQNITINTNKKKMRQFLTWCFENGKIKEFKTKILQLAPEVEAPVIAALPEEIEVVEKSVWDIPSYEKTRDLWLFSSYTGLRFQDTQLSKEELRAGTTFKDKIINGMLYINQGKTADEVGIPLLPQAIAILKRYKYILPKIHNTTANSNLHEMFKDLELNRMVKIIKHQSMVKNEFQEIFMPLHEAISFHKSRKTFVTTALGAGIEERNVRKMSGHKSERAFKKYVAYDEQGLKDEMQKLTRSKSKKKAA